MRRIHLAFILAGLLIFATLAVVTPATATALAASGVFVNAGTSSDPRFCAKGEDILTPGNIGARCTGNVSVGSFDVLASASSDFGRMGVLASVAISRDMTDISDTRDILGSAQAFASFQDRLTFSAGSEAVFTFGVHGGPEFSRAEFGKIGDVLEVVDAPGRDISLTYSLVSIPSGNPVNIGFAFQTDRGADVGSACGNPNFFAGPCDVNQLSDWSDTATLKSVQVLDDKGNPLSGVTITSESGFDYSLGAVPPPVAVPEPTTVVLALTALVFMGIMYLRRRRKGAVA